jgi:hypothetical protein
MIGVFIYLFIIILIIKYNINNIKILYYIIL